MSKQGYQKTAVSLVRRARTAPEGENKLSPKLRAAAVGGMGYAAAHAGSRLTDTAGESFMDALDAETTMPGSWRTNPAAEELYSKVRSASNIPVVDVPDLDNAAFSPGAKQRLLDGIDSLPQKMQEFVRESPGMKSQEAAIAAGVDHARPYVAVGKNFKSPSVLAHELGHSDLHKGVGRLIQNKPTLLLSAAKTPLAGALGFAGGITASKDNNTARNTMLGVGALSAPQLVYEAGASIKGLGRMRRAGASPEQLRAARRVLLPAFGTYASSALKTTGVGALGLGAGLMLNKEAGIGTPIKAPASFKPPSASNTPFLPKGVAGTKMDPRKKFQDSSSVGFQKPFDQKADGIKMQEFKPLSMKTGAITLPKRVREALIDEAMPGLAAVGGAYAAAKSDKNPSAGAALGAGVGAIPSLLRKVADEQRRKGRVRDALLGEGLPTLGGIIGAGAASALRKSPVAGSALGASLGAVPALLFEKDAFATSEFSGPLSEAPFVQRSARGMPAAPGGLKVAGPPPPEEKGNKESPDTAPCSTTKTAELWRHAVEALNFVGAQQKQAAVTSPKSQLAQSQGKFNTPRTTAPPGPSIAQVSKPKGFGTPLPGATKSARAKVALLREAVRVALKDVPNTPRLLMKQRGVAERAAVANRVGNAYDKVVTNPLMAAANKGLAKLPEGKVRTHLTDAATMMAKDPIGHGIAHAAPVPGAFMAYEAGKRGLAKALNKLDPIPGA